MRISYRFYQFVTTRYTADVYIIKESFLCYRFGDLYLEPNAVRSVKAETHDATNRGDKSPRLHKCCDKSFSLSLSLRYVARIQTSLNLCDKFKLV